MYPYPIPQPAPRNYYYYNPRTGRHYHYQERVRQFSPPGYYPNQQSQYYSYFNPNHGQGQAQVQEQQQVHYHQHPRQGEAQVEQQAPYHGQSLVQAQAQQQTQEPEKIEVVEWDGCLPPPHLCRTTPEDGWVYLGTETTVAGQSTKYYKGHLWAALCYQCCKRVPLDNILENYKEPCGETSCKRAAEAGLEFIPMSEDSVDACHGFKVMLHAWINKETHPHCLPKYKGWARVRAQEERDLIPLHGT
ncbi:hypothetical protein GGS20DRAFT_583999 [Poronia punctata]|nr:hypothetical protein GGS20DRAFT_583999 [Poronia punctata]